MKPFASVVFAATALLVGCDVPAPPPQSGSAPPIRDLPREAYAVGRRACELSFKAPATAKFSAPGIEPHGFQQWKVFGEVDSQNAFGALLRSSWVAVVRLRAEKWSVEYLRVGDQESGKMPAVAIATMPPPTPEEVAARKAAATDKLAIVRAAELKHHQDLAAKGDPYGLYRLGKRYLEGDGVPVDASKSHELLRQAIAAGNLDAKRLMALQ